MNILLSMVKKDFKLIFRDKMTVFFTFIFPILFAAFFGSIFSGGSDNNQLSVAVADLDRTADSEAFVQRLIDSDELAVDVMEEPAARNAVRRGSKVAYILIPAGFGEKYGSLFTGGTPELTIGVDPSRQAESGILQGSLMKLGVERFENALSDNQQLSAQLDQSIAAIEQSDDMPEQWKSLLGDYLPQIKALTEQDAADNSTDNPDGATTGMAGAFTPLALNFEDVAIQRDGPQNGYAVTIPQAMYWAIMGVVMGFGVSLVQENTFGTMTRLVTAPITRTQILGGKSLGCFIALCMVSGALFLIANQVFSVPIDAPLKLVLAIASVGVGFVGIMMFLAAIGKTERGVSGLGWGVMMIFAMFGGAMIPLFVMPGWMKTVSHLSPVKWSILAFEGATWRNFSYSELILPCGIMLVLGITCFIIGSRTLKLEN